MELSAIAPMVSGAGSVVIATAAFVNARNARRNSELDNLFGLIDAYIESRYARLNAPDLARVNEVELDEIFAIFPPLTSDPQGTRDAENDSIRKYFWCAIELGILEKRLIGLRRGVLSEDQWDGFDSHAAILLQETAFRTFIKTNRIRAFQYTDLAETMNAYLRDPGHVVYSYRRLHKG